MALLALGACTRVADVDSFGSTSTPGPATTAEEVVPSVDAQGSSTSTSLPNDPGGVADVLVLGDWGAGSSAERDVARAMMGYDDAHDVAAILTTGDNFYSDDWESLMAPFGWVEEREIPFWVTWGNHDVESGARIDAVDLAFDDPPRWSVRHWGEVRIVVLDSNQPGSDEQTEFLRESLVANREPTVIVFHHAPYSCGSHGDFRLLQETWLPMFDEDVFLVLNGHEHGYQRFEEAGVTYVVTGGGGASLTELSTCGAGHPRRVRGDSVHHFLALDQDDGLTVTAIDVAGDVIDSFELPLP